LVMGRAGARSGPARVGVQLAEQKAGERHANVPGIDGKRAH
jgi:hypothetical protein